MAEEASKAGLIAAGQAARLLMISDERIRQIVKLGYIPRSNKGMYPLVELIQGYIKFLKDDERRSSKSATASRMQDAKAAEIEMRIAEKRRELIPLEEADAALSFLVGKVRSEFSGLPARATRDMPLRRKLESEVNGSLNRIAQQLRTYSGTLREGGDLTGGAGGDDT